MIHNPRQFGMASAGPQFCLWCALIEGFELPLDCRNVVATLTNGDEIPICVANCELMSGARSHCVVIRICLSHLMPSLSVPIK